jgi:hypothetical protein
MKLLMFIVGITFAVWLWITYLNLDKIIKGYFIT